MSIVLPKTLAERQAGIKAKRNASSIPYDMVTLQYHDSLDGERLRYHDDKVRYRAAVRSSNAQRMANQMVKTGNFSTFGSNNFRFYVRGIVENARGALTFPSTAAALVFRALGVFWLARPVWVCATRE